MEIVLIVGIVIGFCLGFVAGAMVAVAMVKRIEPPEMGPDDVDEQP